jgi:photosystem I subunit 3
MAATLLNASVSSRVAQESAFKGSCKPLQARAAARPVLVARNVVCSAEQKSTSRQIGSAVAAAALAAVVSFGSVEAAKADVAGLTPCAESKQFAKRQKNEVKGLTKRLKQYEADSAPALALQATIERTEKRFANYAKSGVLCGTDGLPHLISDPGLAIRYGHTGETLIPTVGFLYIAGWIGYVGRNYVQAVKADKRPTEKEIILDVPMAIRLALQGAAWPVAVVSELRSGALVEKDENITVSPR